MLFVTIKEFETTKVYALDNRIYKKIRVAFAMALGDDIANKLFCKFDNYTLQELSTNAYVNIMSCFNII